MVVSPKGRLPRRSQRRYRSLVQFCKQETAIWQFLISFQVGISPPEITAIKSQILVSCSSFPMAWLSFELDWLGFMAVTSATDEKLPYAGLSRFDSV